MVRRVLCVSFGLLKRRASACSVVNSHSGKGVDFPSYKLSFPPENTSSLQGCWVLVEESCAEAGGGAEWLEEQVWTVLREKEQPREFSLKEFPKGCVFRRSSSSVATHTGGDVGQNGSLGGTQRYMDVCPVLSSSLGRWPGRAASARRGAAPDRAETKRSARGFCQLPATSVVPGCSGANLPMLLLCTTSPLPSKRDNVPDAQNLLSEQNTREELGTHKSHKLTESAL